MSTHRRLQVHKQKARAGVETYLCRAIRKYGEHNFTIEPILTVFSDDNLNEAEIICIKQNNPEYNMTLGGEGGDTSKSPNYIAGMKNRNTSGKHNPNYGKRGVLSPKFGKQYGSKPNISKAKLVPVMADGGLFPSIGQAERTLKIKWSYSSKRYPDRFYRL